MHVRSNVIRDDLRLSGDAVPESDDAGDAMAVEEELGSDGEDKEEEDDDDVPSVDMEDKTADDVEETEEGTIPEKVLELANIRQGASYELSLHRLIQLTFPKKSGSTFFQGVTKLHRPSCVPASPRYSAKKTTCLGAAEAGRRAHAP